MPMDSTLDTLVQVIQAGAKYRRIDPALVRTVAARELAAHRKFDAAVKAARSKLHQIAGVYQEQRPAYDAWLDALRTAAHQPGNGPIFQRPSVRQACRSILAHHTSTRERLPLLDSFFAPMQPNPQTVLDLGCGLNPLARAWMPFPAETRYVACDIYQDQADFLNEAFQILEIPGVALVVDLSTPQGIAMLPAADLALALKLLPVLEQIERGAALRLLHLLPAARILVSFPGHSLGGRKRGMPEHYEQTFMEWVATESWQVQPIARHGELVLLVEK